MCYGFISLGNAFVGNLFRIKREKIAQNVDKKWAVKGEYELCRKTCGNCFRNDFSPQTRKTDIEAKSHSTQNLFSFFLSFLVHFNSTLEISQLNRKQTLWCIANFALSFTLASSLKCKYCSAERTSDLFFGFQYRTHYLYMWKSLFYINTECLFPAWIFLTSSTTSTEFCDRRGWF